jgi:hypothetical protein
MTRQQLVPFAPVIGSIVFLLVERKPLTIERRCQSLSLVIQKM